MVTLHCTSLMFVWLVLFVYCWGRVMLSIVHCLRGSHCRRERKTLCVCQEIRQDALLTETNDTKKKHPLSNDATTILWKIHAITIFWQIYVITIFKWCNHYPLSNILNHESLSNDVTTIFWQTIQPTSFIKPCNLHSLSTNTTTILC